MICSRCGERKGAAALVFVTGLGYVCRLCVTAEEWARNDAADAAMEKIVGYSYSPARSRPPFERINIAGEPVSEMIIRERR
ncbi:MAG: hypothetical protein M3348_00080 [Acidobacteriota bacterium]|nr:hypothetical protein [Acidobacteriota bacterium]